MDEYLCDFAFDLVSRSGLFKLLQKIGCPPHLLAIISSFHENMHSTVNYNGSTSEAFKVSSGVKQGCVLAPTLFGIFFSMLLLYAFMNCREGVFLHTRSDGKLFNIARLRAKTKVTFPYNNVLTVKGAVCARAFRSVTLGL